MKRVRGLMSFLLFAILLVSTVFSSSAFANNGISVEIDGQRVNFSDQQPVIIDNRTLVPVRGIFEQLGYDVSWEQSTQTATLSNGVNTVIITVGKSTFTTNGNIYSLDVPAQVINNRTMLPFRAVLESIGCSVGWDGNNSRVIVSSNNTNTEVSMLTPNDNVNSIPQENYEDKHIPDPLQFVVGAWKYSDGYYYLQINADGSYTCYYNTRDDKYYGNKVDGTFQIETEHFYSLIYGYVEGNHIDNFCIVLNDGKWELDSGSRYTKLNSLHLIPESNIDNDKDKNNKGDIHTSTPSTPNSNDDEWDDWSERIYDDGTIRKGIFDRNTEYLIDGTITSPDGTITQGVFDRNTGYLIDGTVKSPDGTMAQGLFDKNTGNLVDGTVVSANYISLVGTFDKDTGDLLEGQVRIPGQLLGNNTRDSVIYGTFEDGVLISGRTNYYDKDIGNIEWNGSFDKTTGDIIDGTISVNGVPCMNISNGNISYTSSWYSYFGYSGKDATNYRSSIINPNIIGDSLGGGWYDRGPTPGNGKGDGGYVNGSGIWNQNH